MHLALGDTFTVKRTFWKKEVEDFVKISGDQNPHHIEPNENGQLVVHGLLTATLPTIIGGQLSVIAKTMEFDFSAPVYTGDNICCNITIASLEEKAYGTKLRAEFICKNQQDTIVLSGYFFGIIRKTEKE